MNSHFRSRILALAWSLGIAVLGVVICLMWLGQDVAAVSSATSAAPAPVAARLYLRAPSVYTYPLTSTLDICETYGPRVLTNSVSSSYDFDLGVDWCAPENIPVHAVTTGTVQSFSGDCAVGTAGCFVQLIHDAADGQTRYSHLASVHSSITDDLQVSPGQVIGWVGKESGASSAYLHFEVHDGLTVTQRAAIHPLDTPFVPWTNRVSPTVVLRGLYTDATGMTALVGVTSPYTEPDVITVSVAVDGAITDSRFIDYVNLNANASGDETLDDPFVQDVCIIPTGLNGTNGYSVTMAFRGLEYSSPATVEAQALDVDGWGSTATVNLVGDLEMVPPEQAANSQPGQAATFVYTLTNRGGGSDSFTLTHLSAQGWSAVVTPTTVTLGDDESVTVTVQVTIDTDESGPPDCGLLVATGTQAGSQRVVAGFYRLHRVIPPNEAQVDGPTTGVINGAYTFTATVAPPTTTVPITYRWQATGQSDVWTTTSGLSHAISFSWDTIGAQTITVTAENAAGVITDTHAITITAVDFPFFDGFESGLLGEGWTVITTTAGRVQVSSTHPYSGTYSALLDDGEADDTSSFAALILNIDLEGQSGVMLDFWWRDFYDEDHIQDGVFISDDSGASWQPVLAFLGGSQTYTRESVYLDAYGLTFNDHFQIKFQFYDDNPIALGDPANSDGYGIDNVWVRAIPLDGVDIGGPELGNIDTLCTFGATVSPPTATLPITYTWSPEPVAGQGSALVTYTWPIAGVKTITVTASNMSGVASDTHTITVNVPPGSVGIDGAALGNIDVPHAFTATVSPPTTTLPITYTWQAEGQSEVVTRTGAVDHTAWFTWSTPGLKSITVTAANVGGIVTGTHAITINVPPGGVDVSGPALGNIDTPYTFTASVSPPTVTLPITYRWEASGQGGVVTLIDTRSHQISFTWGTSGTKVIAVTATNVGGMVTDTHVITVNVPPSRVETSGPSTGLVNVSYVFTANVSPPTTTLPITYTWQATGLSQETHVISDATDTMSFAWSTVGSQTVTVTASNIGGTVSDTHAVAIKAVDFPFFDGFESGDLGAGWATATTGDGRVQVSSAFPHLPSTYSVLLDDAAVPFSFSTAALILNIDLAGRVGVVLDFWWQEFEDDEHAADGVFISDDDGQTWRQVLSFNGTRTGYQHEVIYLDAAATAGGMTFNDHFQIKFQFYDDQSVPADGYAIDDVWVRSEPVDSVEISGPGLGNIDTLYTFGATSSPPTATLPITYVWSPEPVVGQGSTLVTYTWPVTGVKTITVTASNMSGVASDTHIITVNVPPDSVGIDGAVLGNIDVSHAFTATVSPPTTTLPITYTWQAEGQSEVVTSTSAVDHTAWFTWSTPGLKSITVTAANEGGIVTGTHVITVNVPPTDVNITGRQKGVIQVDYSFVAQVVPVTTTVPITYIWEATGLSPQTHLYRGPTDTVSFNWDVTGTKTITVTAANVGGAVINTHVVTLGLSGVTGVAISGPITSVARVATTFTATVSPITATRPVTYIWEFTDRPTPVVHGDGGLIDTVIFTWYVTGTKTVTVTAINIRGVVSHTRVITILRPVPPESVTITGPTEGIVPFGYAFTATVSPVSTTVPITYFWSATDGLSQTHTNGRSDTAIFGWDTPGAKTVTVTAMNPVGAVTQTHVFTTRISPLTAVAVEGPAWGHIQTGYTFTATASPITASVPITYHWRATDQVDVLTSTNTVDHVVTFTWDEPGLKTITVTATNAGNSITRTHTIDVYIPPSGVTISGPSTGYVDTLYAFTANVSPPTATLPITYHWRATDQLDLVTSVGSVDHLASFTWDEPGTKGITVTATNGGGSVTATYVIIVNVPLNSVDISGPVVGGAAAVQTFIAAVSPDLATVPITYSWQATGQAPVTYTDGTSNTAAFTWSAIAVQTVTVTATNVVGTVSDSHAIAVVDGIPFTVYPEAGGALTYTDTQGSSTILQAPAGAVTETITLVYKPLSSATTPVTPNLFLAGHAFNLRAYVGTQPQSSFVFSEPITITIHYSDDDVAGLTEETLNLYYREGSAWSRSGITLVTLDTANNRLVARVAHLSQFAVFGFRVAPTGVIIEGPETGIVNNSYTFTATVGPDSATTPITYHWRATGQGELITTQSSLGHAISFTWDTAGDKTVGVTVTNAGGVTTGTHVFGVEWYTAFLPMLARTWPPPPPNLYHIDNSDGDGSYDVCWSTIASFGIYELEEATNGGFTGATNIYTTANLCHGISDRGPTRYYYRVRYCNGPWCSDWSNVEWVDVRWEKEDNNNYQQANGPLFTDVRYRGRHDEDDYFSVYLGTGEHIVVDLDTPFTMPTPITRETVWLILYDLDEESEQPLRTRKFVYKPPYHLDYTAEKTGWHYIRIFTPVEFRGEEPYTLQARFP